MRIGVVHRHAVDRHVEPCGVGAAQAHRRAADADARFVGGDHRGREGQDRRDVGSVAVAGDLVVGELRESYGRRCGGPRGRHLDLLQAVHAQRIFRMRCCVFDALLRRGCAAAKLPVAGIRVGSGIGGLAQCERRDG